MTTGDFSPSATMATEAGNSGYVTPRAMAGLSLIDGYVSIPLTILIWKVVGWLPSNTAPPSSRGA
jgi:hypothetical protein